MSIAPAPLHLDGSAGGAAPIRRGDDWAHAITWVTDAPAAIDKSGVTILAQLRSSPDSAVVATFGSAVSGAGSNVVTLSLADTVTALLTPGHYVWDYQEVESTVVTTRLAGRAVVTADVSRT